MYKNKTNLKKNKKFNKQHFNQKNNKYPYSFKKNNKYLNKNNIYYLLGEKKPLKPLITTYLHRNKKIKTGIFFKEPTLKGILYPFYLNLKLINEYLKKK
uniref:Ymf100 n=1 Tax=Phytophthora cinnamomi TaxID=4785 RepID=UPI002028BD04|nr:Ymf100 [Phytophthora cinnamomi]DAZ88740.1 TPA_asm: Ymf100 [Phytophthora cinnamomi var. cinnamomi]WRY73344.1 orf100 [Phytophthora cinnamomi]WRY73384.1 orf100 [Phytophthora cinnamomi]WRY73424.1 orf100 [Phytophthora cinnamomi]WRY73464.1 orf100 [Phytophthora cinnamomi]